MAATWFSNTISVFRDNRLPEPALPVGYAALIGAYRLNVPLPRRLTAIGARHKVYEAGGWRILTPRHLPLPDLEGHLVFALKHEGLDLCILKRLFLCIDPDELAAMVRARPVGAYARRLWFLYEWLLGRRLDVPDARTGNYVDVVNPKQQWAVKGTLSSRHRVRNNLPGTPAFCPLVFRTETLTRFVESRLDSRARDIIGRFSAGVLARTTNFLTLKDSKASYAIEGEAPPHDRIQRWGKALSEAGRLPLDIDALLRLQRLVIGDASFVSLGLRREGGFVGEHDRESRLPLPDHVSARHEDLPDLVQGLIAFERQASTGLDPVIAAAILAFGFVYIHPFEDGNGRIHRYLMHHVLSARGFSPPGVVFPVSAAILARMQDYHRVLEDYSRRLLPCVQWEPTERMNVRVLNDTADFYRFFDATPHAEFLFACVRRTIEEDLPAEADFLRRYDVFKSRVEAMIDMPAATIDLLFRFLQQNDGRLSRRAQEREFAALGDDEATRIEEVHQDLFPADSTSPRQHDRDMA